MSHAQTESGSLSANFLSFSWGLILSLRGFTHSLTHSLKKVKVPFWVLVHLAHQTDVKIFKTALQALTREQYMGSPHSSLAFYNSSSTDEGGHRPFAIQSPPQRRRRSGG